MTTTNQPEVTLLLIEDSPDDAAMIREVLKESPRFRSSVEHVFRLEKGIERLTEGGIDVVLLDFSLPDSFGIDTFRRLHHAHPEIPVIVLTSLDDDQLALQAVSEGAQDYLVKKDLEQRLLTRSIRYAIERNRAEQQLLHNAFHDALTGLANRALFGDRLDMAMAGARRRPTGQFAVLFFDLDRFKNINDSLGHNVGDQLLVALARRLETIIRPGDTVARIGGDEFAVLVNDMDDVADAIQVAERILEGFKAPFPIESNEVFVSASIGIAVHNQDTTDPDAMLRDADIAMYRAKASGKARYEIFDPEMHASAVALLKIETELRKAVDRSEFIMHYQPIVALKEPKILGFEGLVRWQHPERGMVAPAGFITVAEETGLIVPLGWWVMEQSCRQIREWQLRFPMNPPLFISVNVSGRIFVDNQVVEGILDILGRTGLPPESLRLEVTENVILEHSEEVMTKMQQLRAMGVQLSIDDFGTGYSSLSYLQRFQYDTLKIDRSFISGMQVGTDSQAIVETILALASTLGIGVIAEGIETVEQMVRLRDLDCPQGQGFWFARPADPMMIEAMLSGDSPTSISSRMMAN
ncbi:MAG: EAL domain-containing protein [Acidobacteria bacterium]|nr:EAL domain-containing protein [Acidobacteriota bacterium]